MASESQIKSVARFFLFAFLDESIAYKATIDVLKKLKNIETQKLAFSTIEAYAIHMTHKVWSGYVKEITFSQYLSDRVWNLPKGVDLESWKQFQRESQPADFITVIWYLLLEEKVEHIAEGLNITPGTIQHRASRGLTILGGLMKSAENA
jgi:hypothetical protein